MSSHDPISRETYDLKRFTTYGPSKKIIANKHLDSLTDFCLNWKNENTNVRNTIFNNEPVKFGFDLKNQSPIVDVETLETVLFRTSEDDLYSELEREIKHFITEAETDVKIKNNFGKQLTKIDKSEVQELKNFNWKKIKFILKIRVLEFQNQESDKIDQQLTSEHYDFQRVCLKSLGTSFIQIESIDTMVRYVFDLSDAKIDWELFMYFEEDFQESLLNLPSLGHKVKIRGVDNSRKLRILNLMIKPLSMFLPVFEDSLVANGDAMQGLRVTKRGEKRFLNKLNFIELVWKYLKNTCFKNQLI